ncbi:hypothetical protein ACLB1R_10765 [Escherichia coli]
MKALPATDEWLGRTQKVDRCVSQDAGKVFTASVIAPIGLNGKLSDDKN